MGIKALSQEDILYYNEVLNPSKLVFTTSKTGPGEFETTAIPGAAHKSIAPELWRHFWLSIQHIWIQLARFLKVPTPNRTEELMQLHRYGIVQYQPQNDKPQVFFKNQDVPDDF